MMVVYFIKFTIFISKKLKLYYHITILLMYFKALSLD